MSTPTSIRLTDEQAQWLASWRDRTMTPNGLGTALSTLREILTVEARRFPLTVAEACILAEVTGQRLLDLGVSGTMLRWSVIDHTAGIEVEVERRQAAPAGTIKTLLDRLDTIGPATDLALRDAFSRWWESSREGSAEGFRSVGLRVVD